MNIKEIRRNNLRIIARKVGGISKLAAYLDRSPSQLSHLIGSHPTKNIGDKLAHTVEKKFNKQPGWLDYPHDFANFSVDIHFETKDAMLPLIEWQDVTNFSPQTALKKGTIFLIRQWPFTVFGSFSFALQVKDNSMKSQSGVSFPQGTVIIVEPNHEVKHGDFVIVETFNQHPQLLLRQLLYQDNKQYFKALNPLYPLIEIRQSNYTIYGVVKLLLYNVI